MLASIKGHTETVKLLLEKGADVNVVDEDGSTALEFASTGGHPEAVKLLLENGANVNAADNDGWTVLMWASIKGHTETVKLLLEKGADVNATTKDGSTALEFASTEGHSEVVKLLRRAESPKITETENTSSQPDREKCIFCKTETDKQAIFGVLERSHYDNRILQQIEILVLQPIRRRPC